MKKVRILSLFAVILSSSLYAGVKNGETAPAFTLNDLDGNPVSLSDFAGKTVVLEWLNPGCPFVRKFYDQQHMSGFQKAAKETGVVWLAINSTNPSHGDYLTPEQSKAWAEEHGFNGKWLMDPDGSVGRAYGATRTPEMFVINPDGIVVYQGAIDSVRDARTDSIAGAENFVMAALKAMAAGTEIATPQTIPYGCTIKY